MKQTQMCESHVHLKTTDELKLFLGHVHTSRRRERGEQITTTDIPAPAIAKNLRVELSRGRMSRPFWACNVAPPVPTVPVVSKNCCQAFIFNH